MIRTLGKNDFERIFEIINDAAIAYKGVIPDDRWKEPYMPEEELAEQIRDGVEFWGYEEDGRLTGVMGIQDKGEVMLIRHAYVLTDKRNCGVGTKLLKFLYSECQKPVLIGTWKAAIWAIRFYKKNNFQLVSEEEKNRLLKKFWNIPERQIENSVVLADAKWFSKY